MSRPFARRNTFTPLLVLIILAEVFVFEVHDP